MGYVQLIIIILFVGIALINAVSRISRSSSKKKDGEESKVFVNQDVNYPSVDEEVSGEEITNTGDLNEEYGGEVIGQKAEEDINKIKIEPSVSKSIDISDNLPAIEWEKSGYKKGRKVIDRIKDLSFLKQVVVMSEVFGKPKGI